MRFLEWLNRLRRSERGNVLIVGAASMPLLIGSAALAVDTIQLSLWKRQLQRAADSGAIAGAYAVGQGIDDLDEPVDHDIEKNAHPGLSDRDVANGSYGAKTLSNDDCATRGITPCFDRAVQVSLTAQRTLPFISIFTNSATHFTAKATAALVDEGEYCVVSLYEGTSAGIVANGNAKVKLGCGMITNSRSDSSVTAGGSSQVEASPIAAVGDIDGEGQNFVGDTVLKPHTVPQADPLAHIPDPPKQTGCDKQVSANMGPGCYGSMDIKGPVTLAPGTYYIDGGDLTINAQAAVTGENVTIVMTGTNGQAGDIKINGGAKINLTAPTSGDYKGVVLYRDRRADVIDVKFNGGAGFDFTGAIYMPTTNLAMLGNFALNSQCLQLVGRILTFNGTAEIENNCPPASGASAFRMSVVRLVG